ncbi:MAG: transcriptional repressor [Bacteroidales bacterium]|nr:transcriptional repressor [Bacteroidales bacterium]
MAVKPQKGVRSVEEFKTQLHRHGLKATRPRIAVHGVMMELVHASPDQVVDRFREAGVKVTVASVYNILSGLADKHIYSRRLSAAGKMFFDAVPEPHVHLYDRENHTYRDVVDDELMAHVAEHLGRRKFKGYTIEDIDVQFIVRPTKKKK